MFHVKSFNGSIKFQWFNNAIVIIIFAKNSILSRGMSLCEAYDGTLVASFIKIIETELESVLEGLSALKG